jgi:SAM-dependent methyltransferase
MSTTDAIIPLASNHSAAYLDEWLLSKTVCPVDHCDLIRQGNWLVSSHNPQRRYPIAYGIPVLLRDDDPSTAWWVRPSLERAIAIANGEKDSDYYDVQENEIHPHVQGIINSTGGYLYEALKGKLTTYPIPQIRITKEESSQFLLDCGCNWGRWTFSAAKKNIPSIGVDPSLSAVIAARQIRRQLNLPCSFVVADCRYLPFKTGTFSDVFSYSVVQHFSKSNSSLASAEFARVLKPRGKCLLQMPNKYGIRNFYHLAKRGFREGDKFDVRYYSPNELIHLFKPHFSKVQLTIDGFFGLGIQPDDRHLMPVFNRIVIDTSETLRKLQRFITPLLNVADSLYLHGVKQE